MTIALLSKPPLCLLHGRYYYSNTIAPVILSFSSHLRMSFSFCVFALKTRSSDSSDLLRKSIVPSEKELGRISEDKEDSTGKKNYQELEEDKEEWVDWEIIFWRVLFLLLALLE